jgi:hypothetical protein
VVNFNYKKFRWSELNKSQCYKIIIPQEEPKQETLEEAAEKRIPTSPKVWDLTETRRSDFIAGANYQAERMYSEEEVVKIINSFEKLCYNYQSNKDWFPSKKNEWFEQFKKK